MFIEMKTYYVVNLWLLGVINFDLVGSTFNFDYCFALEVVHELV